MFHKIMIPLDGSGEAESVLPYLKNLARRFGSQVVVMGVGVGSKRRRVNRLLEEYLDKTTDDLRVDKIEAKAVILYGSPVDKIIDYTEQDSVDLIIMATHGRGGVTRWWMGSVAEKVICEARPPVLLIRSKISEENEVLKKATFSKILAPVDGSDIGEAALYHAEEIAKETGASIELVQAVQLPGAIESGIFGSAGEDKIRAIHEAADSYLGNVAERLREKGIKATCKVVTGDPADEIVKYAEDKKIDLITMSTHGRSGVARWVLGSVADKVLHGAKVPIWLVRSPRMVSPRPKD